MSERTSNLAAPETVFEPGVALGEVNPFSLIDAVNAASQTARTGLLLFLCLLAYVGIATAGVTDKDLLLNAPVRLPLLGVPLGLQMFFLSAPFLVVAVHFGVLLQHVALARKAIEFDAAVRAMEPTHLRSNPVRHELNSYFLTQALSGPERPALLGGLLDVMFWVTIVAAPLATILLVQIAYLPYHAASITMMQRLALVLDILLLSVTTAFMSSRATSFGGAFVRTVGHHPLSVAATLVLYAGIVAFSFLVATIPGEPLDRAAQALAWHAGTTSASPDRPLSLVDRLWNRGARAAAGRFFINRNLSVTDTALSSLDQPTVTLRDRDLRYANLSRSDLQLADLTGADLTGAELVETNLRGAHLSCSQDDIAPTGAPQPRNGCANLTGADAARADLSGADLKGATVLAADFANAELAAARFVSADAEGTSFRGARLQGADLSHANLQGADFGGAVMTAADLEASQIWQTKPPTASDANLADVSAVAIAQPSARALNALQTEADQAGQLGAQSDLAKLVSKLADHSVPAWSEGDEAAAWAGLKQDSLLGDATQRRAKSAAYLAGLSCMAGEPDVVASGIVRRMLDAPKNADPSALLRQLKSDGCMAKRVPDRDLLALQSLVEVTGAAAMAPAAASTASDKPATTADAPQAIPSQQAQ